MKTTAKVQHWQAEGDNVWDDDRNERVAKTCGNTDREAHERAVLFAAAPRLYAALEAWTEFAVNRDVPFELISETRLAIAQARGQP